MIIVPLFHSISCIIPPELKAIIASHALLAPIGAPTILEIPKKFTLFYISPRPDLIHIEQLSSLSIFQTRTDLTNAITAAVASGIQSLPHDSEGSISYPLSATTCKPLTIGNLYLSSCPGKKGSFFSFPNYIIHAIIHVVRLDGPVNGRSGVCRDLNVDIARMRHLGVSCIIWQV